MFQHSSRNSTKSFAGNRIPRIRNVLMRFQSSFAKKFDTRKILLALVFVLVGVSTACQLPFSSSANDNLPDSISADGPIENTIMATIAKVDLSNPRSLAAVNDLLELDSSAVPALLDLLKSPDDLNRWAGIYALYLLAQPEDIPAIAKFLDEPNLSIRARVAATLLMLGDTRGIPVLEEALLSDQVLVFSHPLMLLSEYARLVLQDLHPESLGQRPIEEPSISLEQGAAPENIQHLQGDGVLASQILAPRGDISVSVSDCNINIALNLQFNGPKATQALAATWREGIMGIWNHELSSSGCSIELVVNTKVDQSNSPTEDSNYAQIKIVDIPGYLSNIEGTGNSYLVNDITGTWDFRADGLTAAHEIGHVLGIDDEYEYDVDKKVAIAKKSLQADAQMDATGPGDTTPSIMYQHYPDKQGDYPLARVRHVDRILKAYEVSCICDGLVEWDREYSVSTGNIKVTGEAYTCDGGKTWTGTYESTISSLAGVLGSKTNGEYSLLFDNVMKAETEFKAHGTITVTGSELDADEMVNLSMTIESENVVEIEISSQGTMLIAGGTSVEVENLLIPTEIKFKVVIIPYTKCQIE